MARRHTVAESLPSSRVALSLAGTTTFKIARRPFVARASEIACPTTATPQGRWRAPFGGVVAQKLRSGLDTEKGAAAFIRQAREGSVRAEGCCESAVIEYKMSAAHVHLLPPST